MVSTITSIFLLVGCMSISFDLKFLKATLSWFVCLVMFSGCSYFQKEDCNPVNIEGVECTEEPINICLKIEDKRWCKDGGYGMPKISIYLKRDLALLLKEPMLSAFEDNNLYYAEGGVNIEVEVEQFFCDVAEYRAVWNCVSELIFNVKVLAPCGKVLYSRRISGVAENDFEKTERNGKSRKALEDALEDAMCGLLEDKGFRKAVKKASLSE